MVVHKLVAENLMTQQVRTVGPQATLAEAAELMEEGDFDQIPVVAERKPMGMLTVHDIRRGFMAGKSNAPVGELASPMQETALLDTPLSGVLMALQEQESLLVVDENGLLQGIITYWDVMVLARPYLLTTEIELTLRNLVSVIYERHYGPDWWGSVRHDLRELAEREHNRDAGEGDHSSEHMLGHTSFWALIEILKAERGDIADKHFAALHAVRTFRNQIAHHYDLSQQELKQRLDQALAVRDWMETLADELLN